MLRMFQAAWQKPSSAAYTWFLGARAGETRLVFGTPGLAPAAARIRVATQGRVNRPLWRPAVTHTSRAGFLLSCGSWLWAGAALAWHVQQRGQRALVTGALSCTRLAGGVGLHPEPAGLGANTPSGARLGGFVGTSFKATPPASLYQTFSLSNTLALTESAWAPASAGLQPRPDVRDQGWCVGTSAAPLAARAVAVAGRGYTPDFSLFGGQCAERARAARILAAAWRRHAESRRSAVAGWATGTQAAGLAPLSTPAAQLRSRSGAPVILPRGQVSSNAGTQPRGVDGAPFAVAHGRLSTAATLRYVQAPLAWAPRSA